MAPILEISKRHGLIVIEDAAQAHGAEYRSRRAGSFGVMGCFSFYPGKNLGAMAKVVQLLQMTPRWHTKFVSCVIGVRREIDNHVLAGFNYRMDGIQGAVLRTKMDYIEQWTEARRRHAQSYSAHLAGIGIGLPAPDGEDRHVWHDYSVCTLYRDEIIAALKAAGVGTGIHYPVPVHLQPAYSNLGYKQGDFPVSERLAAKFMSLPMYAEN